MISQKNNRMQLRTAYGSVNYYDNHGCLGTSFEKGAAARFGGHDYDIVTNKPARFFARMRSPSTHMDEFNRMPGTLFVLVYFTSLHAVGDSIFRRGRPPRPLIWLTKGYQMEVCAR